MFLVPIFAVASAIAAQPLTDPRSWIVADDYPAWALKTEAEGTVQIALSIDATGRPDGCLVRKSSGNSDLDVLTCTLLQQRAKFSPAKAESGRAVPSQFVQKVRWAIPREKLISQGLRITYGLDGNGYINGCKINEFGNHDPDLTCSPQMIAEIAQAALAKPLSAYSSVAVLLAMQVDDDTEIAILRPESGERKILAQVRINVSPDGIITKCITDVVAHYSGQSMDLCSGPVQVGRKEFDADSTGKLRTVTVSLEIIGEGR